MYSGLSNALDGGILITLSPLSRPALIHDRGAPDMPLEATNLAIFVDVSRCSGYEQWMPARPKFGLLVAQRRDNLAALNTPGRVAFCRLKADSHITRHEAVERKDYLGVSQARTADMSSWSFVEPCPVKKLIEENTK